MTARRSPREGANAVSPPSSTNCNPIILHDDGASDGAEKADKDRARNAAYRAANPEKVAARHAAYRAANPDKVAAYRAANPEYQAAYRAANPEKVAAYQAAWWAANPGHNFHLSLGQVDALLADHGDLCGICRCPETITSRRTGQVRRLSIDHDHGCCSDPRRSCGQCVRGALCNSCNRKLGKYEAGTPLTDTEWTAAADAYLARYESGAIRELLAKAAA